MYGLENGANHVKVGAMTYKHSSIQQRVYPKKKKRYLIGQWGWGLLLLLLLLLFWWQKK